MKYRIFWNTIRTTIKELNAQTAQALKWSNKNRTLGLYNRIGLIKQAYITDKVTPMILKKTQVLFEGFIRVFLLRGGMNSRKQDVTDLFQVLLGKFMSVYVSPLYVSIVNKFILLRSQTSELDTIYRRGIGFKILH